MPQQTREPRQDSHDLKIKDSSGVVLRDSHTAQAAWELLGQEKIAEAVENFLGDSEGHTV